MNFNLNVGIEIELEDMTVDVDVLLNVMTCYSYPGTWNDPPESELEYEVEGLTVYDNDLDKEITITQGHTKIGDKFIDEVIMPELQKKDDTIFEQALDEQESYYYDPY